MAKTNMIAWNLRHPETGMGMRKLTKLVVTNETVASNFQRYADETMVIELYRKYGELKANA